MESLSVPSQCGNPHGCRSRSSFSEDLKATARSLADIASFMQEVELRQGWTPLPDDRRGIDKIRNVAKHLDDIAQQMPSVRMNGSYTKAHDNSYASI